MNTHAQHVKRDELSLNHLAHLIKTYNTRRRSKKKQTKRLRFDTCKMASPPVSHSEFWSLHWRRKTKQTLKEGYTRNYNIYDIIYMHIYAYICTCIHVEYIICTHVLTRLMIYILIYAYMHTWQYVHSCMYMYSMWNYLSTLVGKM